MELVRQDKAQSFDYQGLQDDFKVLRDKWKGAPAVLALVADGDIRLLTFSNTKEELIHMLGAIIQSIAITPFGAPAPAPAAANDESPADPGTQP
jgi:hypothetical protein